MPISLRQAVITAGGVSEDILPVRLGRSRLIITPITEDVWIQVGRNAAVDDGELIPSGESSVFSIGKFPEIGGRISAFSATTGAKINIRET